MVDRITISAGKSDYIVSSGMLITMLYAQHEQLLKHSNLLFWCALLAFAITAGVFLAGAWCALVDPTGISFNLILTLLKGAPAGLISGGLFWQYNRLQRQAAELYMKLSQERRLALAMAASESIENVNHRDATHSRLAESLATGESRWGEELTT